MTYIRRKCPFCYKNVGSVGSRENVAIDLGKGVYFCWRCGAKGRLNKWAADKLGVPESYGYVSDLDEIISNGAVRVSTSYPVGYVPLYPWREIKRSIVLRRYIKYLMKRHVTPDLMSEFKLGVVLEPSDGQWYMKGNLIYPVLDGERKGYIRRRIDRDGYFNSRGLGRESAFYNGRILETAERVYVVEGPHDVLAMGIAGLGTLGTSVTDKQLERLALYPGEVIWAMDGDAWRVSMVLARRLLLRGKRSGWVRIPAARDPGKLGYERVASLEVRYL